MQISCWNFQNLTVLEKFTCFWCLYDRQLEDNSSLLCSCSWYSECRSRLPWQRPALHYDIMPVLNPPPPVLNRSDGRWCCGSVTDRLAVLEWRTRRRAAVFCDFQTFRAHFTERLLSWSLYFQGHQDSDLPHHASCHELTSRFFFWFYKEKRRLSEKCRLQIFLSRHGDSLQRQSKKMITWTKTEVSSLCHRQLTGSHTHCC